MQYDNGITGQIPIAPSGSDDFQESSYTPYKLVSWELDKAKQEFTSELKRGDIRKAVIRALLVNQAKTLFAESTDTGFTPAECYKIQRQIGFMEEADKRVTMLGFRIATGSEVPQNIIDTRLSEFQDAAYGFLVAENSALQNHGQRYKTKRKREQIERMEKTFVVDKNNKFLNKFGIPISIELELMARIAERRVRHKLDNIFIIQGAGGFGKTTLGWALSSTVAEKLGYETFAIKDAILFNESAQYAEERIRTAEAGSIVMFDEFGNQANKRRFYADAQMGLMDRIKLIRFHGLTIIACWNEVKELDSQLTSRITGIFDINERGTAQLRTFNKNPYSASREFKPFMAKNLIAYTPAEATQIAENYDEFIQMRVPFYEIPSVKWDAEYTPFKEGANAVGRAASLNAKKVSENLYSEFLAKLPEDSVRMSYSQLREFSVTKNYDLSFKALIRRVAAAIGRKPMNIFKLNENPKEMDDGYVEIDTITAGYLKKVKAQFIGAKAIGVKP